MSKNQLGVITLVVCLEVLFKHVRRIHIKKIYYYGITRYRFIRIYTLQRNQSLEHIIPFHALHPLSEKL